MRFSRSRLCRTLSVGCVGHLAAQLGLVSGGVDRERKEGDDEVFNGGEVWGGNGALIESGPLDAEIASASKREHSGYRKVKPGRCCDGCRIYILFSNVFIIFLIPFHY